MSPRKPERTAPKGPPPRAPEKRTPPTTSVERVRPEAPHPAERWAMVTAADLMRKSVVTIDRTTPLSEVERILNDHGISGAPVTTETGEIVGVISMRDLVERYAQDPDAKPRRGRGFYRLDLAELDEEDLESFEVPEESEEKAEDVMTGDVFSVPADAGLREIAREMTKHKVHRVLVRRDGTYVGLISTLEILDALSA